MQKIFKILPNGPVQSIRKKITENLIEINRERNRKNSPISDPRTRKLLNIEFLLKFHKSYTKI